LFQQLPGCNNDITVLNILSHPAFSSYSPGKDISREKISKREVAKQLGLLVLFAPGNSVNLLLVVHNELGQEVL
jgi:hypothetical protein